ncbi:MAG: carboxypeptidase-like regulatory domain-containing protein [Planctomycetota bacterium]|jgi:hypothetical protein
MRLLALAAVLLLPTASWAQGILRVPVVDAEGKPVPGARVQVLHFADISLLGQHKTLVRADVEANEKGIAKLTLFEGRGEVCMLAFHKDQAVFVCDTPVAEVKKHGFRLKLGPATAISGKVLDADKKPVAGARVRLIFPGREELHGLDAPLRADGYFRFKPLPNRILEHAIQVQATAPGYSFLERRLTAEEIEKGATVELQSARTVSGRVVDARGIPVEGAEVWFGSWLKDDKAKSAQDGTFALRGVPDGRVTVHVRSKWHVLVSIPLQPGKGERKLGDVAVADGKPVKGTVSEFDGAKIERAFIALETKDGVRVRSVEAGPGGKFVLPGIGEGAHKLNCWIHAVENIGGTRTIQKGNVRGGDDLKLVAEEGLRLRLLDRNKKPYRTREVRITFGYVSDVTHSVTVQAEETPFHEIRYPPMIPGVIFNVRVRTKEGVEAMLRGIKADNRGRAKGDVVFAADAPDVDEIVRRRGPVAVTRKIPRPKFDKNANKDDVRKYVAKIMEGATDGRNSWGTSDPECLALKRVGSAHVDVLVEALAHPRNTWVNWAIEALVDETHKDLILKALPDNRELVVCVVEQKWARDAEATLVEGLKENKTYVPTEWIDAVASLGNTEHYPLLLRYLEKGSNPSHTWKSIRKLPGLDASKAVERMWQRTKKQRWSGNQAAKVAVEFGYVDALAALVDVMQSGDNWERGRASSAVRNWTGQSGSVEEIAKWFSKNRDQLVFDPKKKKYIVEPK